MATKIDLRARKTHEQLLTDATFALSPEYKVPIFDRISALSRCVTFLAKIAQKNMGHALRTIIIAYADAIDPTDVS